MARDEAYRKAEQMIEEARRTGATHLILNGLGLTEIPESLGQLSMLRSLLLSGNQLTTLPESLGQLSNLENLSAMVNQLTTLPESLGQLSQLKELDLFGNQLTTLPESLGQLSRLGRLDIDLNPLNPELAAANMQGLDAIKRYLRELAKGGKARYEAKLLILGDGAEGKTCVSRALRDLPFADQKTTHGVDVVQWTFSHPNHTEDREKDITLNIWDFEGQEISHQTHQFFLTSQALYLLVFKCREQFSMERAEYWLDTIRARAPQAKVAIVITECEARTPNVPLDRLQAQYGDMLAEPHWFFKVGCENGLNIGKLQEFLQRRAADLEFMGCPWPQSYDKAENALKAKAGDEARGNHFSRSELHQVLCDASVSESSFEDAAAAMARLGVITQFSDCPDLHDFVVLRPQWLTKAISKVMENGQLTNDKGEITQSRMGEIWREGGYDGMFATFHDCMKEFELCYDLEDQPRTCLVPLRFGYIKPPIPWTPGANLKERRVEYKLPIRPPMGLMSRFIVKTHHMIVQTPEHPKGVYWHNGVFLRDGGSEALCEFNAEERKFIIQVRAAYPQAMVEQIHGYLKAVFAFFGGIIPERSYGCIRVDEQTQDETPCSGIHTERRIFSAIAKNRILDCEFEGHDVDPKKLIWGFSSFAESESIRELLRSELDKQPKWADPLMRNVGSLLQWTEKNEQMLERILHGQVQIPAALQQELQLRLREYLGYFDELLDDRDFTSAPGIVSIGTKSRNRWNPANYFNETFVLTPYCEHPGEIHACEDGQVEFTRNKDWWDKSAPWVSRGTKLLASGLLLAFAGVPAVDPTIFEGVKEDVDLMKALTKHLELKDPDAPSKTDDFLQGETTLNLRHDNPQSRILRESLRQFLKEVASDKYEARQWGSLRRIKLSDNSHRWLCPKHMRQ